MEKSQLYLVFDTNAFLVVSNNNQDDKSRDYRTAIQIFQDFRRGSFGTFPPLTVWIPWIVRSELVGLSGGDLTQCWPSDRGHRTAAEQANLRKMATLALNYLDGVTQEADSCVVYQNQLEHEEASLLRTGGGDSDELVLISYFQVKAFYTPNAWLVTNDSRLSARAMRSGLGSITFAALKHAMTLKNGKNSENGDSYLEMRPKEWRHFSTRTRSISQIVQSQEHCDLPESDQPILLSVTRDGPTGTIRKTLFDKIRGVLLWTLDKVGY